jgi:hypothetical protein
MIFTSNSFRVVKLPKFSTLAAVLSVCSSIFFTSAIAGGVPAGRQIPGLDLQDIRFVVPEDLAEMQTEDIEAFYKEMVELDEKRTSTEEAEAELFRQLLRHDDVRISIADLIPQLIENYGIEGEYKKTLLGYKDTFKVNLPETRETVENLDDYPSYDFRFTAVYMSLLFSFQSYPEFYSQLQKDLHDDNSIIGDYRKKLDESYALVKAARLRVESEKQAADLNNLISALGAELATRN